MIYKLSILPEAQLDIQKAFEYYKQFSDVVLANFNNQLEEVYNNLEINPFYQIRFKKLRAIPFKSFPYLVFFEVDQDQGIVFIYSIFHTSQSSEKFPIK